MGHKVAQNEILKRVGVFSDFYFMVFRRRMLGRAPGGFVRQGSRSHGKAAMAARALGRQAPLALPWPPEP